MKYAHTQRGNMILPVMLVTGTILTVVFFASGFSRLVSLLPGGGMLLVAWLFSSLTVRVSDSHLHWHFGPGLLRWKRPLAEIESVVRGQSTWLDGWGIRLTRFGLLYNIAGTDYVKVSLSNGKAFALGTDDPDGLLAALGGAGADDEDRPSA